MWTFWVCDSSFQVGYFFYGRWMTFKFFPLVVWPFCSLNDKASRNEFNLQHIHSARLSSECTPWEPPARGLVCRQLWRRRKGLARLSVGVRGWRREVVQRAASLICEKPGVNISGSHDLCHNDPTALFYRESCHRRYVRWTDERGCVPIKLDLWTSMSVNLNPFWISHSFQRENTRGRWELSKLKELTEGGHRPLSGSRRWGLWLQRLQPLEAWLQVPPKGLKVWRQISWKERRSGFILGWHWGLNHGSKCFGPESLLSDSSVLSQEDKAPRETMSHLGNTQDLIQLMTWGWMGAVYVNHCTRRTDGLWVPEKWAWGMSLPLFSLWHSATHLPFPPLGSMATVFPSVSLTSSPGPWFKNQIASSTWPVTFLISLVLL